MLKKILQAIKSNTSVVDLSTQASNYFNKVKALDEKNSELDLQLELLNDVKNYAISKGKKTGTVPSLLLLNAPTLVRLYWINCILQKLQLKICKVLRENRNDALLLANAEISQYQRAIFLKILTILESNILTEKSQITHR